MRSPTFLKALAVASAYAVGSDAGDCVCPVDGVMMVGVQEIQYVQNGTCTGTERCVPTTIPPAPNCVHPCTTTVITTVPGPSPTSPPDQITTTTQTCTGTERCLPTTIFPPPDCVRPCTTTVITTVHGPPSSVSPPPDTVITSTHVCTDNEPCVATTIPPAPDCTHLCTTTVVTTVSSSTPPPDTVVTSVSTCSGTEPCVATTIPPASDCIPPCTTTVITPTSPPPDTIITSTSTCSGTGPCVATTIPPASDCVHPCTTTVITPTSPPPNTVITSTSTCSGTAACVPTTIPPASDCTAPCTTTVITPVPSPTPTPPTNACYFPPGTCGTSGLSLDLYANSVSNTEGYGVSDGTSGVGPDYYLGQPSLAQGSTDNLAVPGGENNDQSGPDVVLQPSGQNFQYHPGLTKSYGGMTFNANNFTILFTGYFVPNVSGTYQFCTSADNRNELYIGSDSAFPCGDASNGATPRGAASFDSYWFGRDNAEKCASVQMEAGFYYPLRSVYGNWGTPSSMQINIRGPNDNSASTDVAGRVSPNSCALA
ncbi:uncharacterized protein E0L32_010166 [Thyridium curvatum]|uniref:PA14 domain-containing protein n=1 Tax=Thyridium curvatum TaxID=1093900 RepID=A0A507AT50_9PEZI|nr:uncharacterized protein E0L32_010166 [Thyridium curvatum]TPX08099.1 hypothetical protein E0L32_010166 [Thyridium curvatum]